jgi:NAD(P)H-hydrate epimerase
MAAVKTGLMNFPAASLCGQIEVVDIGLPEGLRAWQAARDRIIEAGLVKSMLPPRKYDAHKGTFGTATIAAGSIQYTGAAFLAASAAYRVGTGLVRLAVPRPLHTVLAGQIPEAVWLPLPDYQGVIGKNAADTLIEGLQRTTALLVGPGIGTAETTLIFMKSLLKGNPENENLTKPDRMHLDRLPHMVIDADGLNLLSHIPGWEKYLPEGCILTPHPGELANLTGLTIPQILGRRIETAREWAGRWNQVIILKGAYTVIATPKGRVTVNQLATAALARAGTGDVLAGMATGFLAQGIPAEDAACAAVYLHGKAALSALEEAGTSASVMAGDVLHHISSALREINW